MVAHSDRPLPDEETLLRNWRRWEAGVWPRDYRELIARTFGTVPDAFFPRSGRDGRKEIMAVSGMDTVDILARLRASDVDEGTLDAVRITTDRLCSDYAYMPSEQLLVEGKAWLGRVAGMQHQRLSLSHHREVIAQAGWLALLVGCVEYDSGDPRQAESTRQAALALGKDAGHPGIIGWAHEMRAWFALTRGDYRGVLAAAEEGIAAAPHESVAVQLYAQRAKAWARIGDRQQTEVALDAGRRLLEGLPYPENVSNHFVVDPGKFDFYRMDCYRRVGEDRMAQNLAQQVLQAGVDFDGTERSPMRNAEARVTLGVAAARDGDLESALTFGEQALGGTRRSVPSLAMVSEDLGRVLTQQYGASPDAQEFLHHIKALRAS
ncbi:XRE family transcriptional regulator [Streptomyces sp. NPDC056491]|uniref:XRE family transcriptional regulator n=1 Tax=Streptomyces sp. NPDC056491 TaxID=3345837 RepID=UPI003685E8E5